MNAKTKNAFIVAIALASATLARPVFADSEECRPTAASHKAYEDLVKRAEAAEKAGRNKEAFEMRAPSCPYPDSPPVKRHDALLSRTSLKLGEEAEGKGKFAEAYKWYSENYHGIPADRAQMKMATAKSDNFSAVQAGVHYMRNWQRALRSEDAPPQKSADFGRMSKAAREGFVGAEAVAKADPQRAKRLQAIDGYLKKLAAAATTNGDKMLADEDRIFVARKTSVTAKSDTLDELRKAQNWLGLFGKEKRANDRAVKRGDTLLADDSRKSLELAISYYSFARDEGKERKVREKARRLGDAHLKKGEKKIAADYYNLAGLGDKASKLEEAHEAEKEKAEGKRQGQFKKDQKSLEEELGL